MKTLTFWLFVAVVAQAAPYAVQEETEIEIIKYSCRQLPKAVEAKDMRDRGTDPVNDERALGGKSGKSNDVDTAHINTTEIEAKKYDEERRKSSEGASRSQDYEYKLEVRNSSVKKIVSLKWTYVFADPVTQKQLARHSFESKVEIKPEKQKKIVVYTDLALPGIVNAQAQASKGKPWIESVIIDRVQYSDGTVWERN